MTDEQLVEVMARAMYDRLKGREWDNARTPEKNKALYRLDVECALSAARAAGYAVVPAGPFPFGSSWGINHDGFAGTVQGYYCRRDGKMGVVLQQHDNNVTHVYGNKWLLPASDPQQSEDNGND